MLEKIFTSNVRVKLIQLFVLNPEKSFKLSEIISYLKLAPAAAKKELENLKKIGLVKLLNVPERPAEKNEPSGKRVIRKYAGDSSFLLFDELRSLVVKAQIFNQQNIIEKIGKIGKIRLLLLTGVFVNNPLSPIDLLVVGRLNKIQLIKQIRELERELGKELNFTYFDTGEFIYRRNMTDVFIYEILEGKKIVLIDELNK